jgi:hypothetical protein
MSLNSKLTPKFAIGDVVWRCNRYHPCGEVIKTVESRYEKFYVVQWTTGETEEYYDYQITKERPEKDLLVASDNE